MYILRYDALIRLTGAYPEGLWGFTPLKVRDFIKCVFAQEYCFKLIPRPLPGLCLWTPLGDFRPQNPLARPLSENFWIHPCNPLLCKILSMPMIPLIAKSTPKSSVTLNSCTHSLISIYSFFQVFVLKLESQ